MQKQMFVFVAAICLSLLWLRQEASAECYRPRYVEMKYFTAHSRVPEMYTPNTTNKHPQRPCSKNFFQHANLCVEKCRAGFSFRTPIRCVRACNPDTEMYLNGRCVTRCQTGYVLDPRRLICVAMCPTNPPGYRFVYTYRPYCVELCRAGYTWSGTDCCR